MRQVLRFSMLAGVVLGGAQFASAQSVTFDFEDGTDQGWTHKFTDTASGEEFPIVNIGGSNRMLVARDGDFQEAERNAGADNSPFYNAMKAAAGNEALYQISYDYYIDTSTWGAGAGNFLQLGTYVNSGSGYYAQNFGAVKEVELNGAQVASGQVFQGTITDTFAVKGFAIPDADTFFRLGLIINGDGANQAVYFDNVIVRPVPSLAGDTNDDGVVDLADLNNVLNNFGDTGASPGDDNGDGVVDLEDLNRVLNNFGDTGAAAALSVVPEPSGVVVTVVAGLLASSRSWRRRK